MVNTNVKSTRRKGEIMIKTRKLLILTLIILCSSLLMISLSFNFNKMVLANNNDDSIYQNISTYVGGDSAYQKYLVKQQTAHQDKYPQQTMYPQGVNKVLDYRSYDAGKSSDSVTIITDPTIVVEDAVDPKQNYSYAGAKSAQIIKQADTGTVTFSTKSYDENGILEAGLQAGFYQIAIRYFTEVGYSSSIERSFAINGTVPFDGADALTFSRVWQDNPESYEGDRPMTDTQGNEMKPKQVEIRQYCETYFKDYMGYITDPFMFYLEEEDIENNIYNYLSLISVKEPIVIDQIIIESVPVKINSEGKEETDFAPSYSTYINNVLASNPNPNITNQSSKWEAERTSAKSSPTLYPVTDRSSSKTYPYSYTKTYLNAIGGDNWKVLGDWIEWEFTVPVSGYYNISMRAKQNTVRGMYSSRIVYVDGKVLFEELNDVQFAYNNKWTNVTLGNNEGDYLFYFEAGVTHSIRMEVTLGKYAPLIEEIQEIVDGLSAIYRQIISYTTVTPDAGRDYQLKERFPNLYGEFESYMNDLDRISNAISTISNTKSDKTGVIDSVVIQIRDFLKDNLRSVPTRLNTFSNNISALGSLLSTLRELPLMIDYINVHTPDVKLEKPNEGFFKGLWDGVVSFFVSFFIDYSAISETKASAELNTNRVVEVWMTQGRDQANVIRNIIDTEFTPNTGIKVELKLTAADVLLKATLAGIGPDVALNVDSSLPVNYALRNAVLDLSSFIYEVDANGAIVINQNTYLYNTDGTVKTDANGNRITISKPAIKDKDFGFVWEGETYEEAVVRRYAEVHGVSGQNTISYENIDTSAIPNNFYMESSLSQFQFYYDTDDSRHNTTGTYALPEKQIFLMMFVRDDVMEDYGLSVANGWDNMTWEQVIDLVAELQTYQLQFYLPVNDAGASALNPVFLSLLFQQGGSLYINGNKETGLGNPEAMDAFEQWTEFYTLYSFPKSASFVNRFRTGEMPIGIAYYELYNTLSVFAPELKGKWSFHLIPGTTQEDGTIDHTATASGSGCVILKQPALASAQTMNDSWEFAKWWSSYSAQVSFGREMEGILGSAARHATANVKALNSLAWPKEDLQILMKQWEQSKEISQIAGSYITGREMENAYRQVINKFYNPREVLFEYAKKINNEIDRKREEFNLKLKSDEN